MVHFLDYYNFPFPWTTTTFLDGAAFVYHVLLDLALLLAVKMFPSSKQK